ncbi:capsular exopolysaccharide synthesis family protein [Tumebacillus sp. BK434]|nr:capsular exopolysaccharide synthesis family protein [Tumebacillus sp. BK434]
MEMGLAEMGRVLRQRVLLIVLVTLLAVGLAGAGSFLVLEPEYEATTTLLVQSKQTEKGIAYNDLLTDQKLVTTYGEIFQSRMIAEAVIERLGLDLTEQELLENVRVRSSSESLLTAVTVTDHDPKQAVTIANAMAAVFMENLGRIMQVDNVSILDTAKLTSDVLEPVRPKPYLNMAVALVLGAMAGAGLALLLAFLNNTVQTEAEAEQLLQLPALGAIPFFEQKGSSGYRVVVRQDPRSAVAEAFRTLRTNIQYDEAGKHVKVLIVTSTLAGEGKSMVLANLAVTMAQAGKRVLLIDGDLRKPTLHHVFHLGGQIGLTEVLCEGVAPEEVILPSAAGPDVIPAGAIPANPSELLGSPKLRGLLSDLRIRYDLVLIDSPPLLPVTDGQVLSTLCDGVLFVVRSGEVARDQLQQAKGLLERVGAQVIGAVLNGKQRKRSEPAYSYYAAPEGDPHD